MKIILLGPYWDTVLQDCRSFAGPTTASIQDCLDVALETCGAIIKEECRYTGVRQGKANQQGNWKLRQIGGSFRIDFPKKLDASLMYSTFPPHQKILSRRRATPRVSAIVRDGPQNWWGSGFVSVISTSPFRQAGAGLDVGYFHYYFPTEECRLYSSLEASCAAVGGPLQAPPVADCQGYWDLPRLAESPWWKTLPLDNPPALSDQYHKNEPIGEAFNKK